MKNKTSTNRTSLLIASHAFVIALFTNYYFLTMLSDGYRLITYDTSEVIATSTSLVNTMSLVSFIAFVTAIIAASVYLLQKRK